LHPYLKIEMEVKERIIQEMNRLILTKSCKLITMDEVASNLGISKRTLYENFKDKNQLIHESISDQFKKAHKEVEKIIQKSENTLVSFMLITIKANQSVTNMAYDNINDIKKYYPKIYDDVLLNHIDVQKKNTTRLLRKAIEEGLIIKRVDINLLQNMLRFYIFQCSKREYMLLDPTLSASKLFNIQLFITIRGISTPKGIEIIDKYQDIIFN